MFFWIPVTELGRMLSEEQVLTQSNDSTTTNVLFQAVAGSLSLIRALLIFPQVSTLGSTCIRGV